MKPRSRSWLRDYCRKHNGPGRARPCLRSAYERQFPVTTLFHCTASDSSGLRSLRVDGLRVRRLADAKGTADSRANRDFPAYETDQRWLDDLRCRLTPMAASVPQAPRTLRCEHGCGRQLHALNVILTTERRTPLRCRCRMNDTNGVPVRDFSVTTRLIATAAKRSPGLATSGGRLAGTISSSVVPFPRLSGD